MDMNKMLITAAQDGDAATVAEALKHGADVHAMGDYALRCAAGRGRAETVKLLLDAGADKVNAASAPHGDGGREDPLGGVRAQNCAALHEARLCGHGETADLIQNWMEAETNESN